MALQLDASLNDGSGKGWQSDWLGSSDGPFLHRLCLHQSSRLDGTAHHFPRF